MRLMWLALAIAVAAAQAPVLSQSSAGPAGGDSVRIDVIATDWRGQTVDSLTAGDFSLREDGFEQTVERGDAKRVMSPVGSGGGRETRSTLRRLDAALTSAVRGIFAARPREKSYLSDAGNNSARKFGPHLTPVIRRSRERLLSVYR